MFKPPGTYNTLKDCGLRPAAAGVAKLAARDSQLRVQMLLF